MNKVVFRNCDEDSEYWVALEKLFQTEWSDFLFVDTYKLESNLPPEIVALRENQVIGGSLIRALKNLMVTRKLFGLTQFLYPMSGVVKVLRVN